MKLTWTRRMAIAGAALVVGALSGVPAAAGPDVDSASAPAAMRAATPTRVVRCTTRARAQFDWRMCIELREGGVRGIAVYTRPAGATNRLIAQNVHVDECRPDLTGCYRISEARSAATRLYTPWRTWLHDHAYRACGSMRDTTPSRIVNVCSPVVRSPSLRARPTLTLVSSEYSVETLFRSQGTPPVASTFFRRTDLVGNDPGSTLPDGLGYAQASSWGVLSGAACLASGGGVFTFPDAGPHAFTYGVAGAGVARVRVVAADGAVVATMPGPAVGYDGFRAWLVERPVGDVARIEGLDTAGHVVATVPGGGPGAADDFGLSAGC